MREKILASWGVISARHPYLISFMGLIVIILSAWAASRLRVTMQWSDLLPEKDPMVQEFEKIRKDFVGTANSIVVVVGAESQTKAFADELVPQIRNLKQYVKRVDYKLEENFFRNHGLLLVRSKDLRSIKDNRTFSDFNLLGYLTHTNDNFEDVYIGDQESISDKEKENEAISSLDGIQYWINTLAKFVANPDEPDSLAGEAADMQLIGDPYMISYDKRMLLIIIDPTFDLMDIDADVASTDSIQAIINRTLKNYPSVYAGLTGTIPLNRDEMYYSERDMKTTSIVAFIIVMLLFIFSFRMLTAPILAGLNLILSLIFASGIVSLFVSTLNMMTSMFAVILIGLGIDFSIHIISLYYERRAAGEDIATAMSATLARSGSGIITGAATTAVAFFTLMISQTRGIKEMGLVLGVGILSVMLLTVILLPSLLVIREKVLTKLVGKDRVKTPRPVNFTFLGNTGGFIKKRPVATLVAAIAVSIIMLVFALESKFDYNYLNMEPKGLPAVALQDSMLDAFDMSPDFVMVTANTVDSARVIAEKAKKLASVSMVESISNYIPSANEQTERIKWIEEIRGQLENSAGNEPLTKNNLADFTNQLNRLDMNIYEFGQMAFLGGQDKVDAKCREIIGNPETNSGNNIILNLIDNINEHPEKAILGLNRFQNTFRPAMKKIALRMADTSRITLENIPSNILNKYINAEHNRFLVTIFPKEQVWNLEFLQRFTDQMERLSKSITGTPPLMLRLINLIGQDGKISSMLALFVVFLLLWLDFRELELALIALVPLVIGAVWMVGLMTIFGLEFTIVNVMAIPMIIGIGIDDGVHLMHRYRIEGWGKSKTVLTSTGRAILLTSLTTMAGFGSLLLAKYRGFGSLGSLLVLGVGACFITSVIFLPALVNIVKARRIEKGPVIKS